MPPAPLARRPAPAPAEPRLVRERDAIARAEADLDAGRGIEEAALEAWLDALEDDPAAPAPLPAAPRQAPRLARRVTTAPEVALALRAARAWLTQPGAGEAGRARWGALRDARRSLVFHPYLGAPSEEHPGYRQVEVSGYRLLYRVTPDTGDGATAGEVRIVALFGPGQP